jgi:hypothetical protein
MSLVESRQIAWVRAIVAMASAVVRLGFLWLFLRTLTSRTNTPQMDRVVNPQIAFESEQHASANSLTFRLSDIRRRGRLARLRKWMLKSSLPQVDRLVAALIASEFDLQIWRSRCRPAVFAALRHAVDLAWKCSHDCEVDAGWAALDSAQVLALQLQDPSQLEASAVAFRIRADRELPGWRRSAAQELLQTLPQDTEALRNRLSEVLRLLSRHSADVHFRLRLVNHRVLITTLVLACALTALGLLTPFPFPDEVPIVPVLSSLRVYMTSILLGVIGGMLSLALPNQPASHIRRVYEQAGAWFVIPIARLGVAGASGVVATAIVEAEIVNLGGKWALLLAIPAGFTERLVVRLLTNMANDGAGDGSPSAEIPDHSQASPRAMTKNARL